MLTCTAEQGESATDQTDLLSPPVSSRMGSYATPPDWSKPTNEDDESAVKLGDLLSGRLADVDIDSVEAVRDARERR